MKTIFDIAKELDGVEYREEDSRMNQQELKELGIIVAYGASDDLLEVRGVIDDEADAESVMIVKTKKGYALANESEIDEFNCNGEKFSVELTFEPHINPIWCPEGKDCSFEIIPQVKEYATFNVMEDGELYCIGAVFYIKDLGV